MVFVAETVTTDSNYMTVTYTSILLRCIWTAVVHTVSADCFQLALHSTARHRYWLLPLRIMALDNNKTPERNACLWVLGLYVRTSTLTLKRLGCQTRIIIRRAGALEELIMSREIDHD